MELREASKWGEAKLTEKPEGENKVYPKTATGGDLLEALWRRQAVWDFENKDHPLAIKRRENYLSCPDDPICQKMLALAAELEAEAAKKADADGKVDQGAGWARISKLIGQINLTHFLEATL